MFLFLSGLAFCKAYVLRSIGGGHEISDIQDAATRPRRAASVLQNRQRDIVFAAFTYCP